MGRRKGTSTRRRVTLNGRADWAFSKLGQHLGKDDSGTAVWVIDRLLEVDEEVVARYSLSSDDFLKETQGVYRFEKRSSTRDQPRGVPAQETES